MNYCSYVYITNYSGNVKTEIAKDTRRLSASPEEEIKNIKYYLHISIGYGIVASVL